MQVIHLYPRAGSEPVLHLSIPVERANEEYDVIVALKLKNPPPLGIHPGWPPNFFEETFGSIDDDTFVRPPQGELPKRLNFDDIPD